MASLDEHEVYVEKEGRVLDDDEKPAPDVISVGMAALTHVRRSTRTASPHPSRGSARPHQHLWDPQPPATVDTDIPATNTSVELDEDYADLPELEPPTDSEDGEEGGEEDEDLFAESPTLICFDEGDVELDMDDIPEWYLDEDDEEYSDSGSDGESDA
ncbi:hypothetical protein B0H14DRAFT_2646184 [Mycena olivaceomarginata]|nr:hypothetical protein B0H14DRAFT_2646184 [Mycena olivaceomarginata]